MTSTSLDRSVWPAVEDLHGLDPPVSEGPVPPISPDLPTGERTLALLARASELVCIVAPNGIVTYVSPEVERLRGYPPASLVGMQGMDFAHPDDRPSMYQALELVAAKPDEHPVVVYRSRAADGTWHWGEATFSNLIDDSLVRGIVVNIRDVTQREEAYRHIAAQEARQSAILAKSSDVALLFSPDGTIEWVSPAVTAMFGVDPADLVGLTGFDLIVPEDRERIIAEMSSGLTATGDHVTVEFRMLDGNGRLRWVEEVATDLTGDPAVGLIVANLRDVTARKVAEQRVIRMAMVDPLTELPNRNHLVDRLERSGASGGRGLVFFDIDDFRDVNDALGHLAGDELLVAVARRVHAAVSAYGTLARSGGDQFCVLCEDVTDLDEVLEVAAAVQSAVAAPFVIKGTELFVVVTAGVAFSDGSDPEALLRQADAALSRGKDLGRGRTVVFDDARDDSSRRRMSYGNELHRAIERREIVAFFQPVVDLPTGEVVAVEALARWNHPERGLVPPDLFIPIAESSGLIAEIGAGILDDSCSAAARWLAQGRRLQVAVNASAVELMRPTFAQDVADVLARTGLPAEQLTIEITETAAMRDLSAALVSLNQLQEQGILLALDDFGTGYSSLSFLKRLPVDALKIDRSFVSGMCTSRDDDQIVAGVIGLGLALGFRIVAEGVETIEQADRLHSLGCQYGQGWLWAPAVPEDELFGTIRHIESTMNRPGALRRS